MRDHEIDSEEKTYFSRQTIEIGRVEDINGTVLIGVVTVNFLPEIDGPPEWHAFITDPLRGNVSVVSAMMVERIYGYQQIEIVTQNQGEKPWFLVRGLLERELDIVDVS